ncbi:MAG TPA: hypothetical protein VHM64_07970 [Candidatus Binatia bacterium]|nr:hypothetical protein [Candidatus Binatia bacterium]
MSKILGNELTEPLLTRLSGAAIASQEGKIIPIFTVDEKGWPNPALLSYYEIVAKTASILEMAIWKESSTANNLRRVEKISLMISDEGINFYIKGLAKEVEKEMRGAPQVSRFQISVEQLLEDQEPNAHITSGMTYTRGKERDATDFSAKVLRILRGVT